MTTLQYGVLSLIHMYRTWASCSSWICHAASSYYFDTHSNGVLWVGATCLVAIIKCVVISNFTATVRLTKQNIMLSTRENSTGILEALSNTVIFLRWLTTAKTLTGLLACLIFQQRIFFYEVTWRPNGMRHILPASPTKNSDLILYIFHATMLLI
jgi:hypothetical protein